jgi:hypothetical protein
MLTVPYCSLTVSYCSNCLLLSLIVSYCPSLVPYRSLFSLIGHYWSLFVPYFDIGDEDQTSDDYDLTL